MVNIEKLLFLVIMIFGFIGKKMNFNCILSCFLWSEDLKSYIVVKLNLKNFRKLLKY